MANLTGPDIDFGPLKELIHDDDVYQIMVNGPDQVYVEARGRPRSKVNVAFRDSGHIIEFINHLLAAVRPGVQVSADYPYADARFPNGMRLQAFIPPIAVSGPSLTLRRPSRDKMTLEKFLDWRALNEDMADFLTASVRASLNIMVSGNVGSGKTTLLQILGSLIPDGERIVTIEEEAELRLEHKHVVALERRPPDRDGKGEISIKDLLRMVPRARPDRILIGDFSGPEVLDALRLMSKGYEGTMVTISATSPQEALERLEMMVKMNDPNLPIPYLRSLIASAVNLVVQQNRLEDGTRKVVRITEVLPARGSDYDLHDVFSLQRQGMEKGRVIGQFEGYPASPGLIQRMGSRGITLPPPLVAMEPAEEHEVTTA